MIIEWKINKKRGNYRPVLTYSIKLEDFEKDLALPRVVIQSEIPEPPESWSASCLPDKNERNGVECSTYRIYTPDHKTGILEGKAVLPWRETGNYPEVETSFRALRDNFEKVLKQAYDSLPLEENGRLEMSPEIKKLIAGGIVSEKFLKAVGF